MVFCSAVLFVLSACRGGSSTGPASEVVATFNGGKVTRTDVEKSAQRLPPLLRQEFGTDTGRRELTQSLVDRDLLVQEARKRRIEKRPEIATQIQELEERLILRALLADEEKQALGLTDPELHAYFDAHNFEFATPERVRIGRVLAVFGVSRATREVAKKRADTFAKRLKKNEAFETVARDGDGSEKSHGGEWGLFARGDTHDPAVEAAIFALKKTNEDSPVVETADGYAVFVLLERRPARNANFVEVREQIVARLQPAHQRHVFEELLSRLRADGAVHLEPMASK
jgi:hypothetical protein